MDIYFFDYYFWAYTIFIAAMHTHAPSWIVVSTKAAADIGKQALIPAAVFTALAFIALVLRLYTRVFVIRQVDIGDALLTVSMVCNALARKDCQADIARHCLWP